LLNEAIVFSGETGTNLTRKLLDERCEMGSLVGGGGIYQDGNLSWQDQQAPSWILLSEQPADCQLAIPPFASNSCNAAVVVTAAATIAAVD
jgi:hypothetical protein